MTLRAGRIYVLAVSVAAAAEWNPVVLEAQATAPTEGWLYGAGNTTAGQLGVVATGTLPRRITAGADLLADVISAKAGGQHTLLLRADGSVWALGSNGLGQLGTGASGGTVPEPVQGLPVAIAIAGGANHSLAVDATGHVWAWGSNATGQLGNGDLSVASSGVPIAVNGLPEVVDVAAGVDFSLALTAEGEVWAWGNNTSVQLGSAGPGSSSSLPVLVPFPAGFVATRIAAGGRTGLALGGVGRVLGWGSNLLGQIAPGPSAMSVAQVMSSGVRAMAAGEAHIVLALTNGTVVARGLGSAGQLGNGSTTNSSAFIPVPTFSDVRAVAAGQFHTLALKADGSVWSWGSNSQQQLGRTTAGTSDSRPSVATGMAATARTIEASGSSSLFVLDPPVITASPAAPLTASCGEPFNVSLTMQAYNTVGVTPTEIVLVLDESGSISAASFQQLKLFAVNFVNAQNIGPTANRVGIVMFDDAARTIAPLSSSKPALVNAINAIQQGGGSTCIGCGLDSGRNLLSASRPGTDRIMVVVTDGENNVNNATLAQSIAAAHAASTVFAIGVGPAVDVAQINSIASTLPGASKPAAFFTPDYSALTVIVADLAVDIQPAFKNVPVSMDLSPFFALGGSPTATSGSFTTNGTHVTWTIPQLGATPVTATLPVRGLNRGGFPPVFDAWSYEVSPGSPVPIGVPQVTISGCPASVVLDPPTAERVVGQTHTIVATMLDDFGVPVAGPSNLLAIEVVVVSGPNAGRRVATGIDGQGRVTLAYSSVAAGQDLILGRAATPSPIPNATPATVDWRLPNAAPTAGAGPDQAIPLNGESTASFTLMGSGSDDGQIQPLTFTWSEAGASIGSGPILTLVRPVGVYSFLLTVDDGELSATDVVVVAIQDLSPPVIASSVTGPIGSGGWFVGPVTVTWTVTDPESPVVASAGCDPKLVASDTVGTSFTCTATSAGGSTSATATVKRDATPPFISPPKPPIVEATSPSGAPVTWDPPGVDDATSGATSASCAPASGDTFPLGETLVKCVAADSAGNSSQAFFPVTVLDTTPPALAGVPSDQSHEATGPAGAVASWVSPRARDLVDGTLEVDCSSASGSTFPVGTTLVTCSAKDSHSNGASASFSIVVQDTTSPVLEGMPSDQGIEATSPAGAVASWAKPSAKDLVDGALSVDCTPPSESSFVFGTTLVTCSAKDAHGNVASASFTVTVKDTKPPVLAGIPGDRTLEATGPAGALASWPAPSASDLMDGSVDVICLPASGTPFSLGSTLVTCSAKDSYGNATSAAFSITVKDTTPPALLGVAGDQTLEATGPAGAVASWSKPSAQDLVDGALNVDCSPGSGGTFRLGTTLVACSAMDAQGNVASASFKISVKDTIAPALSGVSGDRLIEATGPAGAIGSWPTPSASDLVAGPLPVVCLPTSGSTFPIGMTLVTCTATDAQGNSGSGSFKVTVRDSTPPVISGMPGALSVPATTPAGAAVSWPAPTASDLISGAVAVVCSPARGSIFAIGTTNVTCAASDVAGNTSSATFAVTVVDDTEPGRMFGEGHVLAPNRHKVDFAFSVVETRRGFEWGRVELKVKDTRRRHGDDDRFEAYSVDDVRFSNAPDYGPGRNSRTGIDTVVFTGTGRWEGRRGYTYTVEASDRGEPGRGRDTFTIEVRAPNGQVVFSDGGTLADGNVQSTRLWRPWAWWGGGHRR